MTTSTPRWRDRTGAIVLAAHRPNPELFRIQLESIRDQTVTTWRCLIGADGGRDEVRRLVAEVVGEDPRFEVVGWDDNVGFYLNFERLLDAVPPEADWVALSDQDDRWYPEKLERLVPELERVALVSGQARLVAWPQGTVLLDATTRRTVPPPYLLLMNQVTGSFSVCRRDLLELALPFPRLDTVTQMHDHWLAVCASVSGGYDVLDVVVQDYVQHPSNVVGEGARGLAALRSAVSGLVDDADRAAGAHGPLDLARSSAALSFGWRRLMRETIQDRLGATAEAALRLPRATGPSGSRRESVDTARVALTSPRVSRMTALTFAAGLPAELARSRRAPRTPWPPNRPPGSAGEHLAQGGPVAVALVLHETSPADSVALRTLTECSAALRDRLTVFLYDNSAVAGASAAHPVRGVDLYRWDPSNPGLAQHYQDALDRAEELGHEWLMLLDQDTEVTHEYLLEVLSAIDDPRLSSTVASICPRLVSGDRVLSPHHPVRLRARPVERAGTYAPSTRCEAWNSGRVIRTSAIRAAGGFPMRYPLDYLDHAVSARLRAVHGETLVLDSRLQHRFSVLDRAGLGEARQVSIARAEERHHLEHGTSADRVFLAARRALTLGLVLLGRRGSPSPRQDAAAMVRAFALPFRAARPQRAATSPVAVPRQGSG